MFQRIQGQIPIVGEETSKKFTKREIPMKDRVWTAIPGFPRNDRHCTETRISKQVTHMVRHHDQDEREEDGAMHGDTNTPKVEEEIPKSIGKEMQEHELGRVPLSWKLQNKF